MKTCIDSFFNDSDAMSELVTRQLKHIWSSWELTWDFENRIYIEEEDSPAYLINLLIKEFSDCEPPDFYHENEDRLAELCRDKLKWKIHKNPKTGYWEGEDYDQILLQGAFDDADEGELVQAATGRAVAAIKRGQKHFDEMHFPHMKMLANVIAVIIYHRMNN